MSTEEPDYGRIAYRVLRGMSSSGSTDDHWDQLVPDGRATWRAAADAVISEYTEAIRRQRSAGTISAPISATGVLPREASVSERMRNSAAIYDAAQRYVVREIAGYQGASPPTHPDEEQMGIL